jgi:hypothetical protein
MNLKKGWNLVGYPSIQSRSPDAPGFLPAECDMVLHYDAPSGSWEKYDPISKSGTLTSMDAGEGYWIHLTSDTTWTVNW